MNYQKVERVCLDCLGLSEPVNVEPAPERLRLAAGFRRFGPQAR